MMLLLARKAEAVVIGGAVDRNEVKAVAMKGRRLRNPAFIFGDLSEVEEIAVIGVIWMQCANYESEYCTGVPTL